MVLLNIDTLFVIVDSKIYEALDGFILTENYGQQVQK